MDNRPYPLEGVTVIDLGQVYQGPYATFLMAKAGANVIKVEPVAGEPLRAREKVGGGAVLPMAMLNTNKRDITLNLKSERGKALLIELVKKGDVLLENYAPGVMEKLGIGADVLLAANNQSYRSRCLSHWRARGLWQSSCNPPPWVNPLEAGSISS